MTNPYATAEERVAINKLGAAIVMISSGTPFFQAGEEMLRTKNGDENSYKSSDEVNNINWELLTPASMQYATMLYYKGLIDVRKSCELFRGNGDVKITFENLSDNAMVAVFKSGTKEARVFINPTSKAISYALFDTYIQIADGANAGLDTARTVSGSVCIAPVSVAILIKEE